VTILEELDPTTLIMKQIWQDALCNINKNDDDNFFKFLANYFSLYPDTEGYHYLKHALGMPPPAKSPEDHTETAFKIVCELFRFTEPKDKIFIKQIVELFKQEWFYGFISRQPTTEDILKKSKASLGLVDKTWHNYKTPFLVRYSNENQFCISYLDEKERFTHASISPSEAYAKGGYINYVENFMKLHADLGMYHKGSDFVKPFDKYKFSDIYGIHKQK